MNYSHEVERMCPVTKGPNHGPAPIPEEGRWVKAYQISDISGLTHGIGWCAPQKGTCKLPLNVKNGIIWRGSLRCDLDQIEPGFFCSAHGHLNGHNALLLAIGTDQANFTITDLTVDLQFLRLSSGSDNECTSKQ